MKVGEIVVIRTAGEDKLAEIIALREPFVKVFVFDWNEETFMHKMHIHKACVVMHRLRGGR